MQNGIEVESAKLLKDFIGEFFTTYPSKLQLAARLWI